MSSDAIQQFVDQIPRYRELVWAWLWQSVPYAGVPWAAVVGLVLGLAVVVSGSLALAMPWARRWWTDETPREGEDERGVSTAELTLTEHLIELRNRIVISAVALVITTAIAFIFYERWMDVATWPLQGHHLQAIAPTEALFAYFKLAFVVGLVLALPVLVYELWAYVAPGLTRKERRYVVAIIPGATFSFVVGLAFAYFVIIPAALRFLLGFGSQDILRLPTVDNYITFLTHLLVACGLIFEMPLAMFFLAKLHVINTKMLSRVRRYAIVIAFVVAAIVTPTPDPFNQLLIAIPILVLYEVGVLLTRWA